MRVLLLCLVFLTGCSGLREVTVAHDPGVRVTCDAYHSTDLYAWLSG